MITLGRRRFTALGKVVAVTVLAAACASARVHAAEEQARDAALADGVTTALGLAAGAAELNPLGPVLAIGMKAAVFHYARSLPDTEQPAAYAMATALWSGAAANNLCVTAAILTGGSFAPVCIAVGAAWAMKSWKDSEPERLFWAGCALRRQHANEPGLECIYTPPGEVLVTETMGPVVLAQDLTAP